nr:hypothetical protein L204_02087 [Cryptococcus depauperatus CBS 7855]
MNGALEKDFPGFNLLKKSIPTYHGVVDASWLSTDGTSLATAESQEKVLVYEEEGKITGHKQNNADKHKMASAIHHPLRAMCKRYATRIGAAHTVLLTASIVFDQLPPDSEHFHSKTMSTTCSDTFEHLYKIEKDTLDSVLNIRKQVEELATAVGATKWDFAGSSKVFFVGRDKSGIIKARVGFIDFTHAEPHE